jgi:hypothetical protein
MNNLMRNILNKAEMMRLSKRKIRMRTNKTANMKIQIQKSLVPQKLKSLKMLKMAKILRRVKRRKKPKEERFTT